MAKLIRTSLAFLIAAFLFTAATLSLAEGEAGVISLRDQGHFYVGLETSVPAENGSVKIRNQMYVGYQLAAEPLHLYPLILVHGGRRQSTDWFSTPDGRDGWRDYFLAAGFDVYWVDRPGYGRSPTNVEYGQLEESTNSSILAFLSRSNNWPGNPTDNSDPAILNWLASSSPGPYVGTEVAAKDLGELLNRIGPAILVTHSAGAISGWWALDQVPDKVAGIISIEPGASNVTSTIRRGLTFDPPLPADFEPVEDAEECALQPEGAVSTLPSFKDKPIYLIGSEQGLVSGLTCAVKAFKQAGIDVTFTYLPDLGFKGNGHYMMAEQNNGEIAKVLIDIADKIK